jgi:hypothetical protein
MFERLQRELGGKAGGAHLHNTRGQGLANVVPRSTRASRRSTHRKAASADAPMRQGPAATS